MNSKVFSSYNDLKVVILMTNIIMSKFFIWVPFTTLLLVLGNSKKRVFRSLLKPLTHTHK